MGKPLHRLTIPETYVQLLYEYLDSRGAAPEAVLGEPWPVPQADGLGGVAIDRWRQLLERAAEYLQDPLLGLHLGQTITPRHLGVLGYVLLACNNLAEALLRFERYQRLIFDYSAMSRREGKDYIELAWDDWTHNRPGPLADETGITALIEFCRNLARAQQAQPLLVSFVNPQPADVQPYIDYFGCPVLFEQKETVVRFRISTLALPLRSADPGLIAVMERQADQLLAQLPQEEPVIEQVRKVTVRLLREGEPDVEAVAAKLFCASRTLQRRLTAAGTSFRRELALVRRQMAETYLRDRRLSIADIALLLGYSEHSAFSRSYKDWTGIAPQQWREREQAAVAP